MKYDDASWHSGGDFPKDLPASAGATHIGMYAAWALQSGLAGELHTDELPGNIEKLARRSLTPGAFFSMGLRWKIYRRRFKRRGECLYGERLRLV